MKPHHVICLVTDRHRLSPNSAPADSLDRLVNFVGAAATAGVDLIQLRERDLESRVLGTLAERCVRMVDGRASLVVNDRLDIALAAGAHGIHLRSDSFKAGAVRAIAPGDFEIGRSVHGAAEIDSLTGADAVDYLIAGTIFMTRSKPELTEPAGLERLSVICAVAQVPVLGIGGIDLEKAELVAAAGASGVAAIGLFIPPAGISPETHLHNVVKTLRRVFDTHRTVS